MEESLIIILHRIDKKLGESPVKIEEALLLAQKDCILTALKIERLKKGE